jgi:hypothetical protein
MCAACKGEQDKSAGRWDREKERSDLEVLPFSNTHSGINNLVISQKNDVDGAVIASVSLQARTQTIGPSLKRRERERERERICD